MSLKGARLEPMFMVPSAGRNANKSIPFPAKGNAIGWGTKLHFDNSPETRPYGEFSETSVLVSIDGGEEREITVNEDGKGFKLSNEDEGNPLWPVQGHRWQASHNNHCVIIIAKEAEDQLPGRHEGKIRTKNVGQGGEIVYSNAITFPID